MNKISISSILSVPEEEIVEKFDSTKILPSNKKTIRSEVDDLIRSRKQRRESKIKLYRTVLRNCIKKINLKNKDGSVETFYKVDKLIFGCPEYDCGECVDYIVTELRSMDFDILQITEDIIYISWKYIEYHRNLHLSGNTTNNIQDQ